nr:FecR family protein [Cellulophaga baltica]
MVTNWLSIAAGIVIFISVAFFAVNYFLNTDTVIETTIAENKNVTLPDGSIIKLDALSSISYQEKDWNANRNIALTGQAFFVVTKGNTFKVTTATGSIEVLGTQFNVNATNNTFEVKCFEGKVKVSYSKDSEILSKGQAAVATQNTLLKSIINTNKPNWMNGFSKYNKSKLMVVINDLQKYYNTTITLPKKYHNLEFTGTITHKNLNKALQTLSTSMEIEYIVDDTSNVTFQ